MTSLTVNHADVATLKVGPGEVLLVSVAGVLSREQAALVKEAFKEAFREGGGRVPSILVVDSKIVAKVVRAADVEAGG